MPTPTVKLGKRSNKMKKIINGKVYDTETALLVGRWDSGHSANDFYGVTESLYRKKTGEYFIHGDGGAKTQYAKAVGNSWVGGELIKPVTLGEAKEFAKEYLTSDEYEKEFGLPDDEDLADRKTITTSISLETKNTLELMRSKTGKSIGAIIDDLVAQHAKND